MDSQGSFRGSLIGGFNKKDVAGYIEAMAKQINELKAENESLLSRCTENESAQISRLEAELAGLNERINELSEENSRLTSKAEQNAARIAELEASLSEAGKNEEAYLAAKEHLAALEFESIRHAKELERAYREKDELARKQNSELIAELNRALSGIRSEAGNMKELLQQQFSGLISGIDGLAELTVSKQEYLIEIDKARNEKE